MVNFPLIAFPGDLYCKVGQGKNVNICYQFTTKYLSVFRSVLGYRFRLTNLQENRVVL